MYLRLSNHCRLGYFRSDLVLLDLKRDEYTVLNGEAEAYLLQMLETDFLSLDDMHDRMSREKDKDLKKYFELFMEGSILHNELKGKPAILPKRNDLVGANIDWQLDRALLDIRVPFFLKLSTWFILLLVYLVRSVFGFYSMVRLTSYIRKMCRVHRKNEEDSIYLEKLVAALNQACLYFPVRVKCLEWASAFDILTSLSGFDTKMRIGVQTRPFSAHAWVECEGKVLFDNSLLPSSVAIIL